MKHSRYIVVAVILTVFLVAALAQSSSRPLSVSKIGDFKIGSPAPYKPGDEIAHPYGVVPPSRFYVYLWQPGIRNAQCMYDECGRGGEMVATLRGWLWGSGLDELDTEYYHLPHSVTSLVLVADANSVIVGIYPNAMLFDLERILKKHSDLANLGMLKGIRQLGPIAVGAPLPFKPTNMFADITAENQRRPKFYVYVVHETINSERYCPYYECGGYIDVVYQAGGAFDAFDHDDPESIKKFGLSPHQVARGEVTLVVVADADGTIVSIHPNKDMRDLVTILSQHPDLTDMEKIYPQ